MLQILAVGMVGRVVTLSAERVLLARGDSFSHMLLQASQSVFLLAGLWVGAQWIGGVTGLLIGVSASRLLAYAPLAYLIWRNGTWLPALDAAAFGVSAIVVAAGFVLKAAI
jgi:hypothetical protein